MRYDSSHGTSCGQSEDQSKVTIRHISGSHEWEWFKSHNPITMTEDTRGLVAIMDEKPAAACAVSHFHGYSVEVHQVILRPIVLRHGWLEASMKAAFGSHVLTVYSYVAASNAKALKFNKHMGMEVVGRIPNAHGPGIDYIVMIGRRENCKYLGE
jgi:hypothetical protein